MREFRTKGATILLKQMEEIVRQSRYEPTIVAWAQIVARPFRTTAERARAILDEIRKGACRIDPSLSETFVRPIDVIAGEESSARWSGDADDMAIAFCAACQAIGIQTTMQLVSTDHGGMTVNVLVREGDRQWTFYMHEPRRP